MFIWLLLISLLFRERVALETTKELSHIVPTNPARASIAQLLETEHLSSISNDHSHELVDDDEMIEIVIDKKRCRESPLPAEENGARSPSSSGNADHTSGSRPAEQCPICCEDIQAEAEYRQCVPCPHPYHQECLNKWLELKPTCPTCQGLIKKEETASTGVVDHATHTTSSGQTSQALHGNPFYLSLGRSPTDLDRTTVEDSLCSPEFKIVMVALLVLLIVAWFISALVKYHHRLP